MDSSSFERLVTIHLAALDLGTGVEQPFGCLIIQNRQAVQSMGRSMDWTLEDDMVDGLFFCATFTGCRGSQGHTLFVQAGAERSDTGTKAVEPDPGCSRKSHSRRVSAGVGVESAESHSVVQPHRLALVICPERRTYVVAVR